MSAQKTAAAPVPPPIRNVAELIAAYARISGSTELKDMLSDVKAYCEHRGMDFNSLLPQEAS